jgi:fructose-bisphosphate aldolase class II
MSAVETAAMRAKVPVAIHLDHGERLESAIAAIRFGCNGVMVDASHRPFEENLAATREVVTMAHACGIAVEGELGSVPGVEGEDAQQHPGEMRFTSVIEAKQFVELTGVDLLAVSIGTVHGRMQGEPNLDFERLQQINASLAIPLVLHGGTGLSADQYQRLIENGIAKINYYTALSDAAGACITKNADQNQSGITGLMHGVSNRISEEVARCMTLWGSAGRASEVLAHCEPWLPVEHLIIYNTSIDDENQINRMMEEGRRVLGAIPGVRRVFTGDAVQESAGYRYTWLVKFCHPAVIDSYREHLDHVTFADSFFRPIAGDRISIDYQAVEPDENTISVGGVAKMSA